MMHSLNRLGLLCILATLLLAGCGTSFVITPVETSNKLDETTVMDGKGLFPDKIAIIEVEGVISDGKSTALLGSSENPVSLFTQQLKQAADDSCVKAVVLRVNSPGGTVSGSDVMYQLVKRFKDKTHKPVVASILDVGASGAYYVSCAADIIVAQPTSLVGSIGVIFETFNLEGTMQKLGVKPENYKSAAHKDMGSWFREPTDEEKQIMQSLVDEYYARFKSIVTSGRPNLDTSKLTMITDGRVFSGEVGKQLGLVDQVGLLEDAIETAKQLCKNPDAKVVEFKRPYSYGGSIYALNSAPTPKSDVLQLQLPDAASVLPTGFYYIWRP
jgi:protease-4